MSISLFMNPRHHINRIMAIPDKTARTRATTNAATIPDFPKLPSSALDLPGMQEFQVLQQNWWDVVRRQITDSDRATGAYAKRLAQANGAEITEIASAVATQDGYLESFWVMTATAGDVVTGIQLYSSTSPDGIGATVSEIAFQADRLKVNTSSGGNKQLFAADASAVKLGDVLTVDLANQALYIGAGNYGNSDTAFFVDDAGRMSLKDKLTWDGSTLTVEGTVNADEGVIGGYTIGATDLSAGANSTYVLLSTLGTTGLQVGTGSSPRAAMSTGGGSGVTGAKVANSSGGVVTQFGIQDSGEYGYAYIGGGASYLNDAVRITGATSEIAFGTAFDTNLYRYAANTLKTDDKLIAAAGLGVGNSSAATAPGSVTHRVPVYDGAGLLLGYAALYDSIT